MIYVWFDLGKRWLTQETETTKNLSLKNLKNTGLNENYFKNLSKLGLEHCFEVLFFLVYRANVIQFVVYFKRIDDAA